MGLCVSGGDARTDDDKRIDQMLREDNLKESNIPKVLLLGTGESGKSTVFKQMMKLYGNGLVEELETYRAAIHRNVCEIMYELCIQTTKLANHEEVKGNTMVSQENEKSKTNVY